MALVIGSNDDDARERGFARIARGFGRWMAGGLAVLLFGTAMAMSGGGLAPAAALEGASLLVVKTVDGVEAHRDLRPGDSVVYRVEFRVNDTDADAPVRVVDKLPAAFAGWEISALNAVVGGSVVNVTLDLPGITSGPSPLVAVGGVIGASEAERTITVGVSQPVQAGAGNDSGRGMTTRDTGVLEYTIKVPETLAPNNPILRTDLVNTATFTAKSGPADLSASDSAIISVDNPVNVDVTPSKSWNPASQGYQPGAASSIVIGATQASNVNASRLILQDPVTAENGAAALAADNPFNFVDFAGFAAPNDPTTNLPAGATSAQVEVYRLSGGTWNWVTWNAGIPNGEIGGVRTTYSGDIPPGTSVSQGFAVEQRAANRATGAAVSGGYTTLNKVRATVDVPGQTSVSKEAEAPFAVSPERIEVTAQKRFYNLPNGGEMMNLTGVTAGDTVGVVLRALNSGAPQSTTIDSLTIAEPGTGSDARFFSSELAFGGFGSIVWPAGATGASITWQHPGGPTSASFTNGGALPTAPAGVTGFEMVFTGAIAPGAGAEVRYELDTSADPGFVAPGSTAGPFRNTIDVAGKRAALPDSTANAGANITLVAPRIDVQIEKLVGPGLVLPGQDVIVQLDTEVKTEGGRTKPTEIVVEDMLTGDGTFWDAFDAKQILPPITRPTNNGNPPVPADLTIRYRTAAGNWVDLVTNPAENVAINVPAGATGVRFVYTDTVDGFSQTTYVKPNISFTARTTLRSDGAQSTSGTFADPKLYTNTAAAQSTGQLDGRTVTGDDTDTIDVGIRGTEGGTGPGPGGLWVDKQWAHELLTSQSGATTWTTQSWAVTQSGYATVELQDPATTNASGASTVFEAFNLTHIRPIHLTPNGAAGTVDPMLRWDTVTAVELWDGTTWTALPAPSGSWMNGNGFKGHTLTAAQQQSTIGVRLVLAENTAARQAAADAGDLTAPAVGSGIAASADTRQFRLDWQLRDRARTADGSLKWVTGTQQFNCGGGGAGCVDNVFRITATTPQGGSQTGTANDTIQLLDGRTNVALSKQVRPLPVSDEEPLAESITMVVPNAGEVEQDQYPRARYTLSARNSSTMPTDANGDTSRGAMKLGKIRVTDTSTGKAADGTPLPDSAYDIGQSSFTNRSFTASVNSPEGNHFNVFNLTGVSFGTLPSYIDTTDSSVELWLYGAPGGTQNQFTLAQAIAGDAAFTAALPYAVGIAVTYSGTDPEQNGNRILVGDDLVMHLDVQLRATERLGGAPVTGGTLGAAENVPNEALARGWDPVVSPNTQPASRDEANVGLTQARVAVGLDKAVTVQGGAAGGKTIAETDPQAPVDVLLTANSNGSTAPLNSLSISDNTAGFWDRFELVSFGTPTNPTDATRATLKVYVGGAWIDFADHAGDLAEIRGAGVVFDRPESGKPDGGLFPQGATSWNASWGTATLPFTVQLRAGATVNWGNDQQQNTAGVFAENVQFGQATAGDDDRVTFGTGTHQLRVVKRAPNDTTTHQVDALASLPWRLEFTNIGTGYLPITRVTDAMPSTLNWDGAAPVVTSSVAADGLGQPENVTLSPDGRNLVFDWPAGARMAPGEIVTIDLGLIMEPMLADQRATNEVVVQAGVPLAVCEQPSDFGQLPNAPVVDSECSNTNYVRQRPGTVVGARKTVNGEHVDTLGENLVSGALDTRTGEECAPSDYLPVGSDYTRSPCASYTAVGATDTWKLENINSGTNPLSRMTVVDMLPNPGDKMLAGGAARTSTFRPVLADRGSIQLSGLPAGATYRVEVTTNPLACVGPGVGTSLWVSDPECADTAANPANQWTLLSAYAGPLEDIVGLRFTIDMTANPLLPAGNVVIEFETVNRVVDMAAEGLHPTLDQFVDRQLAWNQNGVIGWDTAGNRANLPAAPQRAGVTLKTGALVVSKVVRGDGADNAPDAFPVELSCTVPSGVADPARVALDLGAQAELLVPKNGAVTVTGIPIGADCTARESGMVGAHGETGRSIEATPGVTPALDGLSAEILIRERAAGTTALLNLANTYTLGELIVEKSLLSGNGHDLDATQKQTVFEFELVCRANGLADPIREVFELRSGEQYRNAALPEGALCELTETSTGGALSTTITVGGGATDGATRGDLLVDADGVHVLVSNVFDGPVPEKPTPPNKPGLPVTGADIAWLLAIAVLLLGLGAGAVVVRRKEERTR